MLSKQKIPFSVEVSPSQFKMKAPPTQYLQMSENGRYLLNEHPDTCCGIEPVKSSVKKMYLFTKSDVVKCEGKY